MMAHVRRVGQDEIVALAVCWRFLRGEIGLGHLKAMRSPERLRCLDEARVELDPGGGSDPAGREDVAESGVEGTGADGGIEKADRVSPFLPALPGKPGNLDCQRRRRGELAGAVARGCILPR